ncbi:hypothetical protein [Teichococcus aestuarii]
MGAYLLRRLALLVPTLFGIILINFIVVQFAPGGPVEQMLAELRGSNVSTIGRLGESQGELRGPPQGRRAKAPPAPIAARAAWTPPWWPRSSASSASTSRRTSASSP